jgi:hypothetical protein
VLAADCLLRLICSLDIGSASLARRGTKAKVPGVEDRGSVLEISHSHDFTPHTSSHVDGADAHHPFPPSDHEALRLI